jgi:hypothetical protein
LNNSGFVGRRHFFDDQPIAQTLVIPLVMVMRYKFVNRPPRRAFTE